LVVEAPKQDRHRLHGLAVRIEVVKVDLGGQPTLVIVEKRSSREVGDAGSLNPGVRLHDHAPASPQATSTARLARFAADRLP